MIDCWGTCSDAGMPGAVLSCKLVATRGDSVVIIVTKLGILSLIRDQRIKKQGNKRTAKSCETRELYMPADI